MPRPSEKAPIDSLVFEPLNQSDSIVQALRRVAIECESVREGVEPWIDSVIRDAADHRRQVSVARFHRTLAGYLILKPWEQKISSIYVEKKFRGWGIGQRLYGMGLVQLGVTYPYIAFVHDMLDELKPLVRAYSLVLDDSGPLAVINPGDDVVWAHNQHQQIRKTEAEPARFAKEQAARIIQNKLTAYRV
jgi:hypothetical protein